ncbi:MAG: DUF86 domain-containing protein [Salinivirgaceae bacterium]|nr:DUF86 domain-containing protein [Salinivirgaceae bacterium]
MREPLKDRNRLEHILERIDFVLNTAAGYTFQQFCDDKIRIAAISYGTMIIGEAAYMLTKEFKDTHPDTPWRQIEGMRHHIVHGYSQVRNDMLWNVIQNDLQQLREQIVRYLAETDKE